MNNYVVGDIQGCYKGLRRLLKKAKFDPQKDKLWAVGDIVARGPHSLETLEYLHDLGPQFETVLGNHDLHLIAYAYGISKLKPQDRLEALTKHQKFPKYIDFLKSKPLAVLPTKNVLISHAGLYPGWSFKKAIKMSGKVQEALNKSDPTKFLSKMYGNSPNQWHSDLTDIQKLRFSVNALTRMRYLQNNACLDFDTKCHPENAPKSLKPWFLMKNKYLEKKQTILFGHWASLLGQIPKKLPNPGNIVALDTGFVWGNTLSIYCLETKKIIHIQT